MSAKTSKTSPSKPAARRTTRATQPATTARRGAAKKGAVTNSPSVASQLPRVSAAEVAAAKRKFEQGVLTRGEAVPAGKALPSGATHEIVGKAKDGSPILKRKRFSLK
jgi:hypothetical protein